MSTEVGHEVFSTGWRGSSGLRPIRGCSDHRHLRSVHGRVIKTGRGWIPLDTSLRLVEKQRSIPSTVPLQPDPLYWNILIQEVDISPPQLKSTLSLVVEGRQVRRDWGTYDPLRSSKVLNFLPPFKSNKRDGLYWTPTDGVLYVPFEWGISSLIKRKYSGRLWSSDGSPVKVSRRLKPN